MSGDGKKSSCESFKEHFLMSAAATSIGSTISAKEYLVHLRRDPALVSSNIFGAQRLVLFDFGINLISANLGSVERFVKRVYHCVHKFTAVLLTVTNKYHILGLDSPLHFCRDNTKISILSRHLFVQLIINLNKFLICHISIRKLCEVHRQSCCLV